VTVFRLKHIKAYTDRHGRRRHYYRRPGFMAASLPGDPGSREFMDAYHAAAANAPKREIGKATEIPGSIGALIALYYQSRAFTALGEQTRATYRGALERFRVAHADKLVKGLRQRHIIGILDQLGGRQDNLRKVLRLILKHALERGWIDAHPMAEMRRPRKADKGFRAWTAGEVAAFEAKWPTGSRERLALALLLYTGQRRSDVVRMGRQHIRDGRIRVVQQKTGAELWIPLHRALKVEIEAAPKAHLNLLTTQYGEPFSPAGFTNWFRDRARAAGLDDGCTPHGLRKTAAVRLSEAGCTPHEIMAVTGHRNLSEVTLYTAAADQARLAADAMSKVEAGTKSSTRSGPVRQKARKTQ
jgi:integrase